MRRAQPLGRHDQPEVAPRQGAAGATNVEGANFSNGRPEAFAGRGSQSTSALSLVQAAFDEQTD